MNNEKDEDERLEEKKRRKARFDKRKKVLPSESEDGVAPKEDRMRPRKRFKYEDWDEDNDEYFYS